MVTHSFSPTVLLSADLLNSHAVSLRAPTAPLPQRGVNVSDVNKVLAVDPATCCAAAAEFRKEAPMKPRMAQRNDAREPMAGMNRRTMLGTTTALIGGAIASVAAS